MQYFFSSLIIFFPCPGYLSLSALFLNLILGVKIQLTCLALVQMTLDDATKVIKWSMRKKESWFILCCFIKGILTFAYCHCLSYYIMFLFKNCFKLHVNTQFEYKYFICLNQNINHSTEKQVANKKIGEFSAMEYGILH